MNELRRVPWANLPLDQRAALVKQLTPRQHDCYVLWLIGSSYDTIAGYLNLSPRTVRTHIKRARQIHHNLDQQEAA